MRDPRIFPSERLIEVTTVVFQNRFLLTPAEELNSRVVGVVGRAQEKYEMPIVGIIGMSTHVEMLLRPTDPEHLGEFMEFVNCNISKEVGRLRDWKGALWHDRFHHVEVSTEEAAQVDRLRYLLAHGVKEFLVDRPSQWPGVHSVNALLKGEPLVGLWHNRTKEYAARQLVGNKDLEEDPPEFATEEQIEFSPPPCWDHLSKEEIRLKVAELIAWIEEKGAAERRRKGKKSLGVKKILRKNPYEKVENPKKSPKPRFHAKTEAKYKEMREAFQEVLGLFLEASAKLRSGCRDVTFPEGTFPPAQPFVPFAGSARGQPA